MVNKEIAHIQTHIQDHDEYLTCDITEITDYDLVLGIALGMSFSRNFPTGFCAKPEKRGKNFRERLGAVLCGEAARI